MAKGVPIQGKDPLGKAKYANVTESGDLKVQLSGRNDELLTPTSSGIWDIAGVKTIEIPPTDADKIFLTFEGNTNLEIPVRVSFEIEIGNGVYAPWLDGEGKKVDFQIMANEKSVVGPWQPFSKFRGSRIVMEVSGEPVAYDDYREEFSFPNNFSMVRTLVDSKGNFYSVRALAATKYSSDGDVLWVYTPHEEEIRSSYIGPDDKMYLTLSGQDGDSIVRLDHEGDEEKRITIDDVTIPTTNRISLAVDGNFNIIYTGSLGEHIVIRKISSDGRLLWTYNTSFADDAKLAIDKDDNVYALERGSTQIIKINAEGDELWSVLGEFSTTHPAFCVGDDGYLYIGTSLGRAYKVDALTGEMVWMLRPQTSETVDALWADAHGNIYYGARDNLLRKFSPNRNQQWVYEFENRVEDVITDARGNVFAVSRQDKVVKLNQPIAAPFDILVSVLEV